MKATSSLEVEQPDHAKWAINRSQLAVLIATCLIIAASLAALVVLRSADDPLLDLLKGRATLLNVRYVDDGTNLHEFRMYSSSGTPSSEVWDAVKLYSQTPKGSGGRIIYSEAPVSDQMEFTVGRIVNRSDYVLACIRSGRKLPIDRMIVHGSRPATTP